MRAGDESPEKRQRIGEAGEGPLTPEPRGSVAGEAAPAKDLPPALAVTPVHVGLLGVAFPLGTRCNGTCPFRRAAKA